MNYGTNHHRARYSDDVVEQARVMSDEGKRPSEIASELGVNFRTVIDWVEYRTRTGSVSYRTVNRGMA